MGRPGVVQTHRMKVVWGVVLLLLQVDALSLRPSLRPAMLSRHDAASSDVYRTCMCARTDFSGQWEMDLSQSDPLGPVLRELGINRVVAALIARLSVTQVISQDRDSLLV